MDALMIFAIFYIAALIGIVEYIYRCRYLPNMRRVALNNYEDV